MQTNGTLIDDEWAVIFTEYDFTLGVSLDGNRRANAYRVDADGEPTFKRVLLSLQTLKKHKVRFNILTVVTKYVADNIEFVYKFLTSEGYNNLQFIACLPPHGESFEDAPETYMNGVTYGRYLTTLFNLYAADLAAGRYVSVRQLDNLIFRVAGRPAEQCGMNGYCSHQFVIEGDGSVYPCDFYCLDGYRMGNITETDFKELSACKIAVDFIRESLKLEDKCKDCPYFMLCQGGCKRERGAVAFCEGYKYFFPRAVPKMARIADTLGLKKKEKNQ